MTDTDQKPDFAEGIEIASLTEGQPLAGTFEGRPVILIRHGSQIAALSGECTHLGAPLADGIVAGGEIRCPWHHARFSLETGEATGAPGIVPLGCYETEQTEGQVRVTGRRRPGQKRQLPLSQAPVVIVGSGGAGHALADMLARSGDGEKVILLTEETDPPYDRTMCSKQYLSGAKEKAETALPQPGLGLGPAPLVRTGAKVTGIDRDRKHVTLEDGETLSYGTLVLATGAEPVSPSFGGSDLPGVYQLRSLADAGALIAASEKAGKVAILGASFIGLEVAAAMQGRGLDVSVIATDEVPLAKVLGPEAGKFVQSLHEEKGIEFHLGRSITDFDGDRVRLDDGTEIAADILVLGTGVTPRTTLASAAGLTIDEDSGGVLVDGKLTTSDPSIRAIGDIAAYPDPRSDRIIRVEHWVHAQRQGQHLARLLLGETDQPFTDTPFFWTGHYGTQLRYMGHAESSRDRQIEGTPGEGPFAVTYLERSRPLAMLTCKQDRKALEVEARWDAAAAE